MPRVLIIDDELFVCNLLVAALRHGGRLDAASGETGVELIALLAEHDDVVAVICDNQLRGENGIEIHARIEPELRRRKIAFFLLHGSGLLLRERLGDQYFLENRIVEIRKPMENILLLTSIVEAEVARLRA